MKTRRRRRRPQVQEYPGFGSRILKQPLIAARSHNIDASPLAQSHAQAHTCTREQPQIRTRIRAHNHRHGSYVAIHHAPQPVQHNGGCLRNCSTATWDQCGSTLTMCVESLVKQTSVKQKSQRAHRARILHPVLLRSSAFCCSHAPENVNVRE